MTPQKLKKVIKLSTVFITLLIILFAFIITYQVVKINVLSNKIEELDRKSASLSAQAENLQHGIDLNQTSSYIEQQAREEYGLSQDGDKLYIQK